MLQLAAPALLIVAGEENGDRMKIGTGGAVDPMHWRILADVAQHRGARCHTLPELLREGLKRLLVEAERPHAVPGEGDRHPTALLLRRIDRGGRTDRGENLAQ